MEPTTISLSELQAITVNVADSSDGTGLDRLMAIASVVAERQDDVSLSSQLEHQMSYSLNSQVSSSDVVLSIPDDAFKQRDAPSSGAKKGSKKGKSPSKKHQRSPSAKWVSKRHKPAANVPTPNVPRAAGRKPCELCDRTFGNAAKVREHVRVVHDGVMLTCEICSATMKWSRNMIVHLYTKHGIGPEPHKKNVKKHCELCNSEFPTTKDLYQHMEHVHNNYEHYTCTVCQKQFKLQELLCEHTKVHAALGFYRCGTCHLRYKGKTVLTKHCQKYDHKFDPVWYTKDELSFECFKCHKIFDDYLALAHHVQQTTPYNECYVNPNLRCTHCKIQFKERSKFVRHMKDSHGQRIQESGTCKAKAKAKAKARNPKQCKICGKILSWQTTMKYHLDMHKGIKNFKCDLCDYTAHFPSSVRAHRKTHFGEMKYFCRTCGKGFRSRSLWRACEFMHTGKQPVKCEKCGQQFISDGAFKFHQTWQGRKKCIENQTNGDNKQDAGDAKQMTNQSVLHLMMRGNKMAESIDEAAIADFQKPVKSMKSREPKQSEPHDQNGDTSIDSAPQHAEDIAELERMVTANDQASSHSQTAHNQASSQKTQNPASPNLTGQMKKTNPEYESESGDQSEPFISSNESITAGLVQGTKQPDATNEPSTSVTQPSTQPKQNKQSRKSVKVSAKKPIVWKDLQVTKKKRITKEDLKREFDMCDWKEKTENSVVYWKEVSVQQVLESINKKTAQNSSLTRDIFDDIVFE